MTMTIFAIFACHDAAIYGNPQRPVDVQWQTDVSGSETLPGASFTFLEVGPQTGCVAMDYAEIGGTLSAGALLSLSLPFHPAVLAPSTSVPNTIHWRQDGIERYLAEGTIDYAKDGDDVSWTATGDFCIVDGGPCTPGTFAVSTFSIDPELTIALDDSRPGPWSDGGDVFCESVF